jgi:hypothetical protein
VNAHIARPTPPPRLRSQERCRRCQDERHYAFARHDGLHECESPGDSTGPASPIHLSRNHSGHLPKHSAERSVLETCWSLHDNLTKADIFRPLVEHYPSTLSTNTAAQSDTLSTTRSATISTPNSSPEPLVNLDALKFPLPEESQQLAQIIATREPVSTEHQDDLNAKIEPVVSTPISPLEASLTSFLTLTQNAPTKVICQRLSEDWEGSFSDLASAIDFEKKLWALQGLSRLGGLLDKKEVVRHDSEPKFEVEDEKSLEGRYETGSIVHISEDGGKSTSEPCCLRCF